MSKSHHRSATPGTAQLFSELLEGWLKGKGKKTLRSLIDLFAERSFAIIFLLLMALPALPIPTGGITHVTEIITMLLCLELIVGRRTVWLPERWLDINVGKIMNGKAVSRLISVIQWFERKSRRRWSGLLQTRMTRSIVAFLILLFTVAAFVAPPFSGLDTLPAIGVVVISLGLILEDFAVVVLGVIVGSIGISVEITAGDALYKGIKHLF